jgi:GH25 family lysozyme M1 (1,4-beta-N-acetylmuramidase)
MKGVDISHYQDGLTIRQLMDAGKDFAIIKVTEGTGYVDPSAFEYYREAHELGFPLGGYCYSHAMNAQQAMAEAAYLLDTIKGFPLPCGVYLDIEEPEQLALDHDALLQIIRGWCAYIDRAGYTPGIYSSAGTLWAKVHPDEVPEGCLVWIARWSDNPPDLPCDLWQNSDHGSIAGFSGPVDTDEGRSARFRALALGEKPQKTSWRAAQLQLLMQYDGYWGKVDGMKSPSLFSQLHRYLAWLERGEI